MNKWVKKGVFTLACVMTVAFARQSVSAQPILVNSTNFPDDNFRQAVLNQQAYVYNEDGSYMTDENGDYYYESDYIPYISCYADGGVKTLQGVELLNKISSITIYDCKFETADLTSNPELTSITLYGDKLKSIKLANYDIVTHLSANSSGLKFDYTKLKNVKSLFIGSKNIKNFDASKFSNLNQLSINNASLQKIDITKAKQLTYFSLYDCPNVSEIKVGTNPKLESINLCKLPKLASVDVSKCKALTYFSVIDSGITKMNVSKNPNLTYLQVNGDKKLTSVDISKNKKLTSINVGASGIKAINTAKNTKLERLYVYNTKISTLNLKKNKSLMGISYSGSAIKTLPLDTLYDELTITYPDVKKGSSIDLSKYIGKGYTLEDNVSGKTVTYDAKKGIIKTKKIKNLYSSYITLTKGNKTFNIDIIYK